MTDIPKGYTPGPWRVEIYDDGFCSIETANGTQLAEAYNKADADIIASAPDMAAEIARLTAEVERLTALGKKWIQERSAERKEREALTSENEKLRAALKKIVDMEIYGFAITAPLGGNVECEGTTRFSRESDVIAIRKIARSALTGKEQG